jgi:hypothetical protein
MSTKQNSILRAVVELRRLHEAGALGGERMPEDANPGLPRDSAEAFLYFTLPMALNYQRNSYKLWEAALETWNDAETNWIFAPRKVTEAPEEKLRRALCKHKVALQPVRHVANWRTICTTLVTRYSGDVRALLAAESWDVGAARARIQGPEKPGFPYLSGPKLANYWLYVLTQYTDALWTGRETLTVAPDTHVIRASARLGLVAPGGDVAAAWRDVLAGSGLAPIDIHTPLWLWSRRSFEPALT